MATDVIKILILLLLHGAVYAYAVDGCKLHNLDLLQYVQEYMPSSGLLKTTDQGLVYVEIDDNYVGAILKQLKDSRYMIYRSASIVGPHITVMFAVETKGKNIKEFGQQIKFKPIGFYTITMADREYFMLAIEAPELIKIRARYGLTPKPNGHTFNLAVAFRKFDDDSNDE